jgi:hypothetical protein
MDDQMTLQPYETPRVVDYGDLQELTAACAGGSGGDAFTTAHGGKNTGFIGPSAPAYGCTSEP